MRPASRKFRAGLQEKVERLEARVAQFEGHSLAAGQNPGYDRLAEALYLMGRALQAQSFAKKAAAYWAKQHAQAKGDSARCESVFHLSSALLFADDVEGARASFARGVTLYVGAGMAASDDTGYMAALAGEMRRAEVVFHAAAVADMGAQGMSDLKLFEQRFPDTPRLLKLRFVQGVAKHDAPLVSTMALMKRWLTPEPEGITSFRTEEWLYAAHFVVLAQLARGEPPVIRLYDPDVELGLQVE